MNNIDVQNSLNAFYDTFVTHKSTEDVINGLDFILKRGKSGSFSPSMLLTGGSGAGKSYLINHYVKSRSLEKRVSITRVGSNLQETLVFIINELNAYKKHRVDGPVSGLIQHTIDTVKRSDLQLLVIEEAQELFENTTHKERQNIRDELKRISDQCQLPIVFVGMPSAKLILEDTQWRRRLTVKAEIPYFSLSNDQSMGRYMELLDLLQNSLPLPTSPKLDDFEMACRLLSATDGIFGNIIEIIGEALSSALEGSSEEITINDFARAFYIFNGSLIDNPFEIAQDKLVIKEIVSYDSYIQDQSGNLQFIPQEFKYLKVSDIL